MRRWSQRVRPLVLETSVGDETGAVADREQLERGFRRLKPEQRAVLVLHYYSGFSAAEIAQIARYPRGDRQIPASLLDRGDAGGARSRRASFGGRPEQDGMMTTNDRFDGLLSGWLEESAPDRLPERVLSATFERTRVSRQSIGWRGLLGRTPAARSMAALGGAAVVVTVGAALALGILTIDRPSAGRARRRGAVVFAGTWYSTSDADGGTQTMTVRVLGRGCRGDRGDRRHRLGVLGHALDDDGDRADRGQRPACHPRAGVHVRRRERGGGPERPSAAGPAPQPHLRP